ncbi:MAG: class I SAM-dependent methyltransferase [Gammaproteobacteria bacterium]
MMVDLDCPLCGARSSTRLAVSSGDYRHCNDCDFVFLEPAQRPSAKAERAYYGTHDNRVDDPAYRRFLSQLADPLLARLAPGAGGLDFGAGPGPALAAMLTERGHPTDIYDVFFAPDTAVLDRAYDFVTCTEVVEHLHAPAREFGLFGSLLARGGWLGLMTELRPPLAAFPAWYYHRDPTHVSFYSEATMRWLARAYGWEIDLMQPRVIIFRVPTRS